MHFGYISPEMEETKVINLNPLQPTNSYKEDTTELNKRDDAN